MQLVPITLKTPDKMLLSSLKLFKMSSGPEKK